NATARLGRGSAGQVLTSDGTDIAWATPSGTSHDAVTLGTANGLSLSTQQLSLGLASSGSTGALSSTDWNTFNGKFGNVLTTTGDIIYSSSGTTGARLGVGSSGQVLTVDGGLPSWKTPSTGFYRIITDSVFNSSSTAYTMYQLSSSNASYIGMAAIEITTTSNAHYGYVYMIVSGAYNGGSCQTNYTLLVNNPGSGVSVDASLIGNYVTANIYNSSGTTKKFRLMIMPYF
ncbi:MAG TPA: hypothetical protein PLP88_09955, partial [Bacteroidales bacterium]|nr:hypothetical protein [Bacteroidales bacterium]